MTASPAAPPDVPGYVLSVILGTGGTSVVWAATDALGSAVAIKVPRDASSAARRQTAVEHDVLLSVSHDHLVPLRDIVVLGDGRSALVFDLVRGAVLRAMVRARGRLEPGEVVTILTPICQAVDALHAAGGVHGDVSPGNVMVTTQGRPVLLDLGACKVIGHDGDVYGTTGFIAPEVREGVPVTSAADVYSLGAIAWFCLTGNGAPDTSQRLDLDTIRSHVGPELCDVVAAAIDPDPARRPDAARLAGLCFEATTAVPVEVVVGGDDAAALTHRLRADAALAQAQSELPGRRFARLLTRLRMAGVGVLVSALVGVGAWFLLGRSQAMAVGEDAVGAATVPAVGPSPGATSGRTALVQEDPRAPRQRPVELMQWLSDQRGAALVARDIEGLRRVHRAGSPSLDTDTDLIRHLLAQGNRYEGVRLTAAEATWLEGDESRATVRARIDWSGYSVVNDSGTRSSEPAAAGTLLDFTLSRGDSGWRVASVHPVPTA